MNQPTLPIQEIQQVDALIAWLRQYYVVCAAVYLLTAIVGGWYAFRQRNRWIWILPVMGVLYAAGIGFHWQFTNDDSYIFFRYAENIAHGMGPVYNPGTPCEGFTSPAWTYTLAAGTAFGGTPHILSKALGTLLGALAILMMVLAAKRMTNDTRVFFLTAFFVTTSQILMAWIPSGMDTALFLAWLSSWVYILLAGPRSTVAIVLLAAAGAWIRPEAYFISFVGVLCLLYSQREDPDAQRRWWLLGGWVLAMALPVMWRLLTFGELLPTTYFAKSDRTLRNGLGFLFGAVNGYGPVVWAIGLAGLWMMRRTANWAIASILAIAAYVVWVGGDVLIQRFSLWWMPFVAIGLAAGLRTIASGRLLDSAVVVPLIAALLSGQELHRMYCVTRPMSEHDGYVYVSANAVHTAEADAPIGRYLKLNGQSTDTVVTDNIGAIGYFGGTTIMDVNGLIDVQIATLIHHNRLPAIATLIAARRPQWIVCYRPPTTGRMDLPNVGELPLDLMEHYVTVGQWRSRTGYTRWLLRREVGEPGKNAAPQN